jgi:hypothetical protein
LSVLLFLEDEIVRKVGICIVSGWFRGWGNILCGLSAVDFYYANVVEPLTQVDLLVRIVEYRLLARGLVFQLQWVEISFVAVCHRGIVVVTVYYL